MKTTTQITTMGLAIAVLWQMISLASAGSTDEAMLTMADSPAGRIALHLMCVWRDHRFQWHWRGVMREFARV